MYLVPFSKLQERYGLSVADDVCLRGTNAIATATIRIEEYLRTYFVRDTKTELFKVDSAHHPWNEYDVILALPKGAVVDGSTIISTHSTLAGDKTVVDSSKYLVSEDGIVTLPADSTPDNDYFGSDSFDKTYISVEYTAGYDVDGEKVYQDVPAYLEEAALLVANHIFMDDEGCGSEDCVQGMSKLISGILTRHIRYYPVARDPV